MKKLLIMQGMEGLELVSTYINVKDLAKFSFEKYEPKRIYIEKTPTKLFGLTFKVVNLLKISELDAVGEILGEVSWLRGVDKKAIFSHIEKNMEIYEQSEEAYVLRVMVDNISSLSMVAKIMMDYNLKQNGRSLGELIISMEEQKEVMGVSELIIVKNSISFKKFELEKMISGRESMEASIGIIRKFNKLIDGRLEVNTGGIIIAKLR